MNGGKEDGPARRTSRRGPGREQLQVAQCGQNQVGAVKGKNRMGLFEEFGSILKVMGNAWRLVRGGRGVRVPQSLPGMNGRTREAVNPGPLGSAAWVFTGKYYSRFQ